MKIIKALTIVFALAFMFLMAMILSLMLYRLRAPVMVRRPAEIQQMRRPMRFVQPVQVRPTV